MPVQGLQVKGAGHVNIELYYRNRIQGLLIEFAEAMKMAPLHDAAYVLHEHAFAIVNRNGGRGPDGPMHTASDGCFPEAVGIITKGFITDAIAAYSCVAKLNGSILKHLGKDGWAPDDECYVELVRKLYHELHDLDEPEPRVTPAAVSAEG